MQFTCGVHKIMTGEIEVPPELIEGKTEDEKFDVYKALICKQLEPMLKRGYFILEDEIEICDS